MARSPKQASPDELAALDALVAELAAIGEVERGAVFGMPAVKHRGGAAFAGLFGGDMAFKLEEPEHAEALGLDGAKLFDPSGRGRPFKQWVQVPARHRVTWVRFAEAALRASRP